VRGEAHCGRVRANPQTEAENSDAEEQKALRNAEKRKEKASTEVTENSESTEEEY
jgi:hypothetical protein